MRGVNGCYQPVVENLYSALPEATRAEVFTDLLKRPGLKIERIVSHGQVTPDDTPLVQAEDEWVILLSGKARMQIEDSDEVTLNAGDYLYIPAGQLHWVTWTDPNQVSVWLAVHIEAEPSAAVGSEKV